MRKSHIVRSSERPAHRYDIFISYRHSPLDESWARWLVRALETYRPPPSIVQELRSSGRPYRISRVYRDEEEAAAGGDLSDGLKEALSQSRNLLVICSRNTPGSKWVSREIAYFKSLGGGKRVLPLVIEGQPDDAFPEALRDQSSSLGSDGDRDSRIHAEPFAANATVRGAESRRKARHRALLKIVAGALEISYDDLFQRDRRRRRARLLTVAGTLSVALIASLSWWLWTRTDAYQIRMARANAPSLALSAAYTDQLQDWCRILVLTGHPQEAVRLAQASPEFAGGRVEPLLATAEAARLVEAHDLADRLTSQATELAKEYPPKFSIEMRLAVAASLFRQKQSARAEAVVADAMASSHNVPAAADRVAGVRELARLIVEVGDRQHLGRMMHDNDKITAVVSTIVAARAAATENQIDEARRLAAVALATATSGTYPHQPFLVAAVIDATVASGWLSENLDSTITGALRMTRKLRNDAAKARALRHIGAALAGLGKPERARPRFEEITDEHERNDLAEVVIKAFARIGNANGVISILTQPEFVLHRDYLVLPLAEGLAEGGQIRIFPQIEPFLSEDERRDVRLVGSAAWKPSASASERSQLIEELRHLAKTLPDDESQLLTTIEGKLLEAGRGDEALVIARETRDPHSRTFALIAVAEAQKSQPTQSNQRALLMEAAAAQEHVQDPELQAVALREVGRALKAAGYKAEATTVWKRGIDCVRGTGTSNSSTVADIAEELARVGELRIARIAADTYCEDRDRLRVYVTILLPEGRRPAKAPQTDKAGEIF